MEAGPMVKGVAVRGKQERFAPTPWTEESGEWQALDERLPADHLARRVDRAVEMLDLGTLFDSYLGAGKRALRPDLLVKLMLYELQYNRPSPAQWARDVRENDPVRWLLFGMEPSRARLYDFRERVAPYLQDWNAQVLQVAVEEQLTPARRVSLDSSSVAAHASRRQLLNEERLQKRRDAIDEGLRRLAQGETVAHKPGWLAETERGLREQKQRYERAAAVLRERQAANAQRRSDKRKPAEKVLVSPTDPEAVLARDKLNVFRPLYSVQLLRDLDSPLVFSYDVFTQNNDNGVLELMVERMADHIGRKPDKVLVDSGYVSIYNLAFCSPAGIALYGPCQENDYSLQNGKKPQHNQHTSLPKSDFRWLKDEQMFQCPEGHRLHYTKTQTQSRTDHTISLDLYTCPAEHCLACPRQSACTKTPHKGRTVSRMENEDLLDELRARMQTEDAKRLYKLRSQTVELNYADLKEHRGLRRFHGRGTSRVTAEVGLLVLVHNMLHVEAQRRQRARDCPPNTESPQTYCVA
jgi:transposase